MQSNTQTNGRRGAPSRGKLREKRQYILSAIIHIIRGAVEVLAGFLLSTLTLPFSTTPFGVALLAGASHGIPFALAGAVIGAVTHSRLPIMYVCAYGATVLLRLFLRLMSDTGHGDGESDQPLFSDRLFPRVLTGMLVSFVIGVYTLIAGGFRYYDLFGAFFGVACTCFGVFVVSFALGKEQPHKNISHRSKSELVMPLIARGCRFGIVIAMIYSAVSYSLPLFSLSTAIAFFMTLYYSTKFGSLPAALTGLVLGFAANPAAAPLYMLSGAVCSMIYRISPTCAVAASVLCSAAWCGYIGGLTQLSVIGISAIVAGAAFIAFDKLTHTMDSTRTGEGSRGDSSRRSASVSGALASRRLADHNEQLRAMSTAFSSLSEVFYNLSDRLRRPGTLDLRRICDGAFDLHCPGCAERELCWGLEYATTLEVMNELTKRLHTHGRVELECLPEYLTRRCHNTEEIISEINRSCARMTEAALRCEKTEVFALDYEGMARILCETLDGEGEEYKNNEELSRAVSSYLEDCGISGATVVCFGGRRKQIIARGLGQVRSALYSDNLREDIEKLSGYQLTGPIFEPGDGFAPPSMVFTAKPCVSVECTCRMISADSDEIRSVDTSGAHSDKTADGTEQTSPTVRHASLERLLSGLYRNESSNHSVEAPCGDTVNVFVSRKDYFYALISDGMGSGEEAAFTSALCSVFLEKMLGAGNTAETSLRMLGGFIRSRSGSSFASECSATVDLLELDLLTANASFIKSGAAQSYVVRDGEAYRLTSRTVPLGILRDVDAQRLRLELRDGDVIVMTSDGITQGNEDCPWLVELITDACERKTPHGELAEQIIKKSRHRAHLMGYERYDDASVVIIRVQGCQ